MSSHREAPEISKDPVADNTDTYAFVSPDKPGNGHDHHQLPAGRGAGGRSDLLRVRQRRSVHDLHRQRRRRAAPTSPTSSASNRRSPTPTRSSTTRGRSARWATRTGTNASSTPSRGSTATATTATGVARSVKVLGEGLACPPCNIGPRSTPNYPTLAARSRSTRCRAARRCSPDSATTRSSSTSDRSSISPTCARSRTCT